MAGNRKFHNKFHSANHHTIPSPHIIDSGLDPIASHDFPFIGDFVLNGTVSGSNNYLLNGLNSRTLTLDSIRHGMHPTDLGLPGNWNIFRDSTYIDGDAVITGNLSAVGELTYLHTQVYSTSANEIDVRANNNNGKSTGLRVDQHGTNDVLHVYNDAISTLIITGSADQPVANDVKNVGGQLGINLGSLNNVDRPNQRMTIVGSVSVTGDPHEYLDQNQQIDPGVTGSLYIEGGLHVNSVTYLDELVIDTTDGKTYVSGAGLPGAENPLDVDVPILLDRVTIDTSDGDTFITGPNKVYIDATQGLVVDTHSQLDQLTVDTTDGDMLIEGTNWLRVDTRADFNKHVNLDSTHIDTSDGNFTVSGSNKVYVDTTGGLDVDTHTQLDQLTVDTTDGKMNVKGGNILDVQSHTHLDQVTIDTTFGKTYISGNQIVDIESHANLDQVTIDTDSGKTYISGSNILDVDTAAELDQVTINTTDGKTLITHDSDFYDDRLPVDVDVPIELTKTTVDTTSGDFNVEGSGDFKLSHEGKFIVETETELNKLTVDVTKGDFLIKGKSSGNIFDINVNTSINDATLSAGDVHITTGVDKNLLVDGGGRVDYKTEVFFDNEVELDKTSIDTTDGEFRVHNTDWDEGRSPWHNVQEMNVNVPTLLQSLTANTNNEEIVIEGSNRTLIFTPVDIHGPVLMTSTVDMTDQVRVNNLSVSGFTDLDETHIDTTDGNFIVSGSGDTNIQTYAVFDKSVYIKGNLRVDGNAWLSAGYDGKIYVGDTDGDNVIFHADIDSDMLPNLQDVWRLGRPGKRWLDVNSFAGTFSEIFADNTLNVDGKTELDETEIITDDGSFVISGSNPTTFYTDVNIKSNLTLEGQLSATKGPWIFTGCELNPAYYSGSVNPVDQTDGSTDNVSLSNLPYHQFQVDCNSLFSRGLTANGPVQIGELPDGVTDELLEPTLEVLGNLHVREGNIKIVSDIRHLEDENTLIRFKPDTIEFRAGDAPLLTLTEKDASPPAGRDIVEIGSQNTPADLKIYKQSETNPEAITFNSETGETRFDGNIGVNGDNEAAPIIGEGIDVHGSVRVTETLSAKNLIVDYITVQEGAFGNIGGSGTGGGSELAPVSGVAVANETTTEYVEGETIVYEGVPVGITFDITEEQNTIQKLFSFTFEAQSADLDLGINIGDVQTTTYQFAAKWDEYWSEAFVNDVEYGIVHTSDNPFAEVSSVVLSATHAPTNERIVKIIVKPTVDLKFFSHNVLAQIKPKRLDTVTTADFDVNGDLSVFGQVSAAQGLTVDGDHLLRGEVTYLSAATFEDDVTFKKHVDIKELSIGDGGLYVKGDLRVDGNAYLSAGTGGVINVGDSTDDIINFTADVASDITPNIDSRYTLGSDAARWQTLHTRNVSAVGLIDLDGRQIIRGVADQFYYKRPTSSFSDFVPAYFWPQVDINENIKTDQVLKLLSMSDQQVTVELENGTTQTLNVTEQYTDGADESYTVNESVFSGEPFMGYDWTHTSYYGPLWEQPMTIIETSPAQGRTRSGGLDLFIDDDNDLNLQTIYGIYGPYDNVNFVNIQHNVPFVLTTDQAQLDVNIHGQFTMSPYQPFDKASFLLSIEIDGAIYSRHINDFGTTYSFDETITITPEDCNLLWDPQGNAPQYPNFDSGKSVKFGFWFANGTDQAQRVYPETHDIHVSQLGFRLSVAVDNPSTPDLIPGTYVRGTAWELAERSEAWEALTVFGNSMLSGAATVRDNIHGQSDFRLSGNASLSGTLTVGDNTTLQKNLNVSGHSHLQDTVTIEGHTQINNNVEITGTQDVSGTIHTADDLRVDGDTFLSGGLIVDEDTILNSDLHVKGDLRVDGNAYLSAGHDGIINVGDSDKDNVVFHGDIDSNLLPNVDSAYDLGAVDTDKRWRTLYTRNVSAVGTIDLSGSQTIYGDGDTLTVYGDTDLDGKLDVIKITHLYDDLRVDGDTFLSGAATVDQDILGKSNLTIEGNTYLSGTADVIDTIHGQSDLHIDGVTHLSGAAIIEGHTTIDNNLLVTGTTKLSGHLEVDDDADIHGDVNTHGLTASGDIYGKDNLTVDKHAQINETMNVVDDAKFDSNVHIKGDLRVDGNAYLSAGASGSINVGDTETDIVIFNADIGSDVVPDISDSFDLGTPDKTWNEVHWRDGNSLESNSVYDFVSSTSGEWGYANLSAYQDDSYVLRHDQVPPLAITHVRRVTNSSLVTTLKDLVYRGDIVLVADTEDNLVAIVDHPTGEYDKDIAEYTGYERLFAPGNMVRFINGHQGPSVTLDPDDLDDTDTEHKFVAQGEIDNLHSVYTNVQASSAARDSVYITTNASSADWYSVYTNVQASSAARDSVYITTNNSSGDWYDTRTTLAASSGDWYDTRTTLAASSGEWYDTRTSVMSNSGEWDSVYSFVNSDSATNNTAYNQTTFVNTSGDTITGDLSVTGTLSSTHAYFTTMTALSSYIDVVDIKVRELSGFDIIDGDLTVQGDISATGDVYLDKNSLIFSDAERFNSQDSKNAKSVYGSVLSTSADWNDTRTTLAASSADWYDTRTTVNASSADWYDARTTLAASSGEWYDTRTTVNASSADWYDTRVSVMETSGSWNSVYSHVNNTSGYGYATVGADGRLEEHLVPNLSITETYVVTYDDSVADLCSGQLQGPVDIERGDVVIITSTEQNLIAVIDNPTGSYNTGFDTFDGFSKLQTPTDYIKTINGKQGLMVTLNPDDMDDDVTAHKFVDKLQKYNWDSTFATVCAASAEWDSVYTSVNETSAEWDSVYSFVNSDSATNNTDYNQTTFVNASGDTITGDLIIEGEATVKSDTYLEATTFASTFNVSAHTTLETLNVSGATVISSTVDVHEDTVLHSDLHVKGDLRVDGNAFLSAGSDGNINVGDVDTDNVVFRADVDSNFLADKKDIYTLGSEAKRWLATYSMSGLFDYVDIHDLDVSGVAKFTGKTDERGPGIVVRGTPTGIFDLGPYGFDDNGIPRADSMDPDVDIVGDVAIHGSLSADNAHIFSLTASHFKAEYQKLMVNDGDLELLNGNIKQRGGNVLIESDLGHVDDENTYMRFQPDEITFYCHDVKMLQFQELTTGDDIITIGDSGDAVDIIVQNPTDTTTLYIDGDKAYIGIGTDAPAEKLHVATGQAQFATGDNAGAVMITSGTTDERVDKTGSIRWNSELNRYEGYRDDTKSWVSLQSVGDSDGDTYVSVDAGDYPDSDRLALYTAGCSAMTLYPNQTVAFAGDIQFDNITIYDNDSVTGPLSATTEFIYLKVNGKDRAIRLWATPEDTREDIETLHGENVTHIGDECGLGHGGQIPTQTISAHPVLFSPPTQRIGLDTDGDGIVDYLDPDDDGDGIPDYMDMDHELTEGMNDSDGDGIADPFDTDRFENNNQWDGGGMPWQDILSTWETLTGSDK